MNYSRLGRKYGVELKEELIKNIQSKLEKKTAAYIRRHSKKFFSVEAKLLLLSNNEQTTESVIHCSEDKYDRIIDSRAAACRQKSANIRQSAIEEAMKTYKKFSTSLETYVIKLERRSDWHYRQFILAAAKHSKSQQHSEPICFKSQAYKEFAEKLRKDLYNYEI